MPRSNALITALLTVLLSLFAASNASANTDDLECSNLPPVAWDDAAEIDIKAVVHLQFDLPPGVKHLYLTALCGVKPATVKSLIRTGEGAVVEVPAPLARSMDGALPHYPRTNYVYIRGGGVDREVVVIPLTETYTGPFILFDVNYATGERNFDTQSGQDPIDPVAWQPDEVRRVEEAWNSVPYESMRQAAQYLHDAAQFQDQYKVTVREVWELFGIGINSDPNRAFAWGLGTVMFADRNPSNRPSTYIHELGHFVHYYMSGPLRSLVFVDEFTSISRRNATILGESIPFWFKEKYPESDVYDCSNDRYVPFGYVSRYARCGEARAPEDFAETFTIAVGASHGIHERIKGAQQDLEAWRNTGGGGAANTQKVCNGVPIPAFLPSSAYGTPFDDCAGYNHMWPGRYELSLLYDATDGPDASLLGQKAEFMHELLGMHKYRESDADGDGTTWTLGMNDADCSDLNPVESSSCGGQFCTSAADCNDGDPCTVEQCSSGACVYETRDQDGDGAPDGTCGGTDCDDTDPAIGPGSTRTCQSNCGARGESTCRGGQWTCNAPTSCQCQPGQAETIGCGNCGEQTRICQNDGTWGPLSACSNEGVCSPNTERTSGCGTLRCAGRTIQKVRVEQCSATCGWTLEQSCAAPPGSLEPELCDGVDNDCDQVVDEGCPNDLRFVTAAGSQEYGDSNHPKDTANCAPDEVLAGMEVTRRLDGSRIETFDSVTPICRPVRLTGTQTQSYAIELTGERDLHELAAPSDPTRRSERFVCPDGQAVSGMFTDPDYFGGGIWGRDDFLHQIQIHCSELNIDADLSNKSFNLVRSPGAQSPHYWNDSTRGDHYTFACSNGGFIDGVSVRSSNGGEVDTIQYHCTDIMLEMPTDP